MAALDKNVTAVSSGIKRVQSSVNRLGAEKADASDVKKIAAELNVAVSTLQTDLKTMDANIEALDLAVKDQLEKLVARLGSIENRLIEQEAQIVTVTSDTVDKVSFKGELKLLEERITQNRGKDLKIIQLTLDDLQRQLTALTGNGAIAPAVAPSSAGAAKPAPPPPAPAKPKAAAKPPATAPAAPKSGQIIEQPLK